MCHARAVQACRESCLLEMCSARMRRTINCSLPKTREILNGCFLPKTREIPNGNKKRFH